MKQTSNILSYSAFLNESKFLQEVATGDTMTLDEAISMATEKDFIEFLNSATAKLLTTKPYVMQSTQKQIQNGTFCFGRLDSPVRYMIYKEGYVRVANYATRNWAKEMLIFKPEDVIRYNAGEVILSTGEKMKLEERDIDMYGGAAKMLIKKLGIGEAKNELGEMLPWLPLPKYQRVKYEKKPRILFVDANGNKIFDATTNRIQVSNNRYTVKLKLNGENLDGAVIKKPMTLNESVFIDCSMRGVQIIEALDRENRFESCNMEGSKIQEEQKNHYYSGQSLSMNKCNLTGSTIKVFLGKDSNIWDRQTAMFLGCNLENCDLDIQCNLEISKCEVKGLRLNIEDMLPIYKEVYEHGMNSMQLFGNFHRPLTVSKIKIADIENLAEMLAKLVELEAKCPDEESHGKSVRYDFFIDNCDFSDLTEQQIHDIFDACGQNSVLLNKLINNNRIDTKSLPKKTQARVFSAKAFGF